MFHSFHISSYHEWTCSIFLLLWINGDAQNASRVQHKKYDILWLLLCLVPLVSHITHTIVIAWLFTLYKLYDFALLYTKISIYRNNFVLQSSKWHFLAEDSKESLVFTTYYITGTVGGHFTSLIRSANFLATGIATSLVYILKQICILA